jgi:hypothetical protein
MAWVVLSDMVLVDLKNMLLALQFSFDAVFLHQSPLAKGFELPPRRQLIRIGPSVDVIRARPWMDNFFLLVIGVLFILLAGLLIFYFQTQQNFKEITDKLEAIEHPQTGARSAQALKRDLAMHRDVLFVLEADISKTKRETLTEEELKIFDVARHHIKASIAGLKANGDWIGLPFDYEWNEMLDRLPNVLGLYRKAEAEKQAQELQANQVS